MDEPTSSARIVPGSTSTVVDDVAVRLLHVLLQVAAEGHVDHLPASTHGEQRYAGRQRPSGDSEVECVLLVIDVVHVLAEDLVPVDRGGEVAAAGEQHAVGEVQAAGHVLGAHGAARRHRMHRHRLAAGAEDGLGQCSRCGDRCVAVRGRRRREASGDGDDRRGHLLTLLGVTTKRLYPNDIPPMPLGRPLTAARIARSHRRAP